MKMTNYLTLAALAFLNATPALLASTAPQTHTYEFQYTTTTPGFSPTYVWVTAALDTPVLASLSILNYQVTTPEGTWTPTSYQPNPGTASASPFWARGQVEVTGGGSTLLFTTPADLNVFGQQTVASDGTGSYYNVHLTTTSISDTTVVTPLTPVGSSGSWSLVPAGLPVPEASNTLLLFAAAVTGLGVYFRFQRARASISSK